MFSKDGQKSHCILLKKNVCMFNYKVSQKKSLC